MVPVLQADPDKSAIVIAIARSETATTRQQIYLYSCMITADVYMINLSYNPERIVPIATRRMEGGIYRYSGFVFVYCSSAFFVLYCLFMFIRCAIASCWALRDTCMHNHKHSAHAHAHTHM